MNRTGPIAAATRLEIGDFAHPCAPASAGSFGTDVELVGRRVTLPVTDVVVVTHRGVLTMRIRLLLLSCALILAGSRAALAQERSWDFGVSGAYVDFDLSGTGSTAGVAARATRYITPSLAVEMRGLFARPRQQSGPSTLFAPDIQVQDPMADRALLPVRRRRHRVRGREVSDPNGLGSDDVGRRRHWCSADGPCRARGRVPTPRRRMGSRWNHGRMVGGTRVGPVDVLATSRGSGLGSSKFGPKSRESPSSRTPELPISRAPSPPGPRAPRNYRISCPPLISIVSPVT